jgi:hypothetical protein
MALATFLSMPGLDENPRWARDFIDLTLALLLVQVYAPRDLSSGARATPASEA